MVVACVAALIALGGTGIAAVAALPRGSVTTSAIRDSAVTTKKLANKAVTLAKLAANARIPGPKGDPGAKGERGLTGDIGPSDAYVDTNEGPVTLQALAGNLRVATVRVPTAGIYVIWAKANLDAPADNAKLTGGSCDLVAGPVGGPAYDTMRASVTPGSIETVSGVVAREFSQATSVNLNCSAFDVMRVEHVKLVAIKIGKMTTSTG